MLRIRMNKKWMFVILPLIFSILIMGALINSSQAYRLRLANYYIKRGNDQKAIELYSKVLRKQEIYKQYVGLKQDEDIPLRYTLAQLFVRGGDFLQAARLIRQIVRRDPLFSRDILFNVQEHRGTIKFGMALFKQGLPHLALNQFRRANMVNPDHPLGFYYAALLLDKMGDKEKSLVQMSKVVDLYYKKIKPDNGNKYSYFADAFYRLANNYEKSGDLEKARDYYKEVLHLGNYRSAEACYHLFTLLNHDNQGQVRTSFEQKFRNMSPQYKVPYALKDGARFLGYSLNVKEFELFNEGLVAFFWEIGEKSPVFNYKKQNLANIYKLGSRLVIVKEIKNLAPNFGFEADSPSADFPLGWNSDYYHAPYEIHEIQFDMLPLGRSQCLVLNNSQRERTNCQTELIPVNDQNYYMQAGWIKSMDGRAFLGRRWLDENKNDNGYDYVVLDVKDPKWKHYAQVIKPQPGSLYCRLWATNFMSHGEAFFDDIVFFKLEILNYI